MEGESDLSEPDYYEVLGVSPTSDEVVIKAAHKAMMMKYHPDTNRSGDAENRAKAINEAYAVLRDPSERRRYDERRARSKASSSAPRPPPESDAREQPRATKSYANPAPPPPTTATKSRKHFIVGVATVIGCIICLTYLANTTDERQPTPPRFEEVQSDTPPSFGSSEAELQYEGADSTPIQPPPVPPPEEYTPTLGEFDDSVRAGARDFVTVVRENGIIGARLASQSCAERIRTSNNILDVDRCVAFDIAANMLDSGVSEVSGAPRDGYFANRGFDMPFLYARFDQFSPNRLAIISSTVEQVLNEELSKTE